jgi:hypothetical protein
MWIYSSNGKKANISYTKRSNDFSGHIFFTDLNDIFINGWVYENGKIIQASGAKLSSRTYIRMQPLQEGCYTYEIYNYERICNYYNDGTVECTEWEYTGSTTETYCYDGGTGTGEYDDENIRKPMLMKTKVLSTLSKVSMRPRFIKGNAKSKR